VIGKNKSVGPDSISGEILKLVGEATIQYLAQLLDITIMSLSQETGEKPQCFMFTRGGDRSLVSNYRPVSLTSVVCKETEHIIALYL
jgi:hypothetical protein